MSVGRRPTTKPTADALADLKHISVFAFGGVGIAGRTSSGERDFRIIMAQSPAEALRDFDEIYAQGDIEAKCYALVAIRKLDPERFRELDVVRSADVGHVQTMH